MSRNPSRRKKRTAVADPVAAAGPVADQAPRRLIKDDGTLALDLKCDSFVPEDMAKWLPVALLDLVKASTTVEEWRGKMKWLVAMIFYKVRNMNDEFIDQMLLTCKPLRDGIVDTASEKVVIQGYQSRLQNAICDVLGQIATAWLASPQGIQYLALLSSYRKAKGKAPTPSVHQIDEYFNFSPGVFKGIWYPIAFVVDQAFWQSTMGLHRRFYNELRLSTLVIIGKFVQILTTGRINQRVLSVLARKRVLNATSYSGNDWPMLLPGVERPRSLIQWEELDGSYPAQNQCEALMTFLAKFAAAEKGHQMPKEIDVVDLSGGGEMSVEPANETEPLVEGVDNPVIVLYDDLPSVPMETGAEFSYEERERPRQGLVTLAQYAEIDRENREDTELDNEIIALVRPQMSHEALGNYVCNEAIRIALTGPLGVSRWAAYACEELIRRNDDLCLLMDRRRERCEAVIRRLDAAADEAVRSVERLEVIKRQLDKKVEDVSSARKRRQQMMDWANEQRATRTHAAGARPGERGRPLVPQFHAIKREMSSVPEEADKIAPVNSPLAPIWRSETPSPVRRNVDETGSRVMGDDGSPQLVLSSVSSLTQGEAQLGVKRKRFDTGVDDESELIGVRRRVL